MDNLFSDMGKFGIKLDDDMSIFEEEKKPEAAAAGPAAAQPAKEEDFLLERSIKCPSFCMTYVSPSRIPKQSCRRYWSHQ